MQANSLLIQILIIPDTFLKIKPYFFIKKALSRSHAGAWERDTLAYFCGGCASLIHPTPLPKKPLSVQ